MSTASMLDEIMAKLEVLPPAELAKLQEQHNRLKQEKRWLPNPGPQTEAYFSEADELLFGGEAGGGKSDLLIGLALTAHERSLIMRRTNNESSKMIDRFVEVIGTRDGYNGQDRTWRIDGRTIDIAGCQHEDDKQKWKGNPHDLKAFDELVDFTESQYLFIITWNRTTKVKQRCRVVATTNPPTRPEGFWVVRRWAAWLDPKHPRPARDGELRWYTTGPDGKEIEVDGPGPHIINGTERMAKSRTFIRSRLSDNPDLMKTDYAARLDSLPEELRLAYREGRFDASIKDTPFQCIPSDWVRAAMQRWTPQPRPGVPMCAMGVDCSGGGQDPMMIAPRYDGWYPKMIEIPAKEIPMEKIGKVQAGHVLIHRMDNAIPVVDMGGGYGGPVYEHLRENGIDCIAFKGAESSVRRTQDKQLRFINKRTEAYWKFREALDPAQPNGSPIFLPDDPELLAELCAPTWELKPNGIQLEPKEDVVERLGHSPNKADAVVMAWFGGPTYLTDGKAWRDRARGDMPKVVAGRQPMTARRR